MCTVAVEIKIEISSCKFVTRYCYFQTYKFDIRVLCLFYISINVTALLN